MDLETSPQSIKKPLSEFYSVYCDYFKAHSTHKQAAIELLQKNLRRHRLNSHKKYCVQNQVYHVSQKDHTIKLLQHGEYYRYKVLSHQMDGIRVDVYDTYVGRNVVRITTLKTDEPAINEFSVLGKGTFGVVYSKTINREKCAVKRIETDQKSHSLDFQYFLKEMAILKVCSFLEIAPSTISNISYDIRVYKNRMESYTEICEPQNPSGCSQVYFEQEIGKLKQSVHMMHQNKIIHNDIKTANIMYSPTYQKWVLIDFGESVIVKEEPGQKSRQKIRGTPQYFDRQKSDCFTKGKMSQLNEIDLFQSDRFALEQAYQKIKPKQGMDIQKVKVNMNQKTEDTMMLRSQKYYQQAQTLCVDRFMRNTDRRHLAFSSQQDAFSKEQFGNQFVNNVLNLKMQDYTYGIEDDFCQAFRKMIERADGLDEAQRGSSRKYHQRNINPLKYTNLTIQTLFNELCQPDSQLNSHRNQFHRRREKILAWKQNSRQHDDPYIHLRLMETKRGLLPNDVDLDFFLCIDFLVKLELGYPLKPSMLRKLDELVRRATESTDQTNKDKLSRLNYLYISLTKYPSLAHIFFNQERLRRYPQGSMQYRYTFLGIAKTLFRQGKVALAQQKLRQLIDIQQRTIGTISEERIQTEILMVQSYLSLCKSVQALKHWKFAIKCHFYFTCQSKHMSFRLGLLRMQILLKDRLWKQAVSLGYEIQSGLKQFYPKDPEDRQPQDCPIALRRQLLIQLAQALLGMGDIGLALKRIQQAIASFNPDSKDADSLKIRRQYKHQQKLGEAYHVLASVYYSLENYQQALIFLKKSIKLTASFHYANTIYLVDHYRLLIKICNRLNDVPMMDFYLGRINILLKDQHKDLAQLKISIQYLNVVVLRRQGLLEKAATLCQSTLHKLSDQSVVSTTCNDSSKTYLVLNANFYHELGLIRGCQHKQESSLAALESSVVLKSKVFGIDDTNLFQNLLHYSQSLLESQRPHQAAFYASVIVDMVERGEKLAKQQTHSLSKVLELQGFSGLVSQYQWIYGEVVPHMVSTITHFVRSKHIHGVQILRYRINAYQRICRMLSYSARTQSEQKINKLGHKLRVLSGVMSIYSVRHRAQKGMQESSSELRIIKEEIMASVGSLDSQQLRLCIEGVLDGSLNEATIQLKRN